MSDMRLAINVLNRIKDNYSKTWCKATIPNHKGIPLTSSRWQCTNPYYSIHPYINGREQGFAIEVVGGMSWLSKIKYEDRKIVIFSEDRKSDSIVVYVGLANDFDSDELNPHYIFKSERRYHENAKYFSPSKINQAVTFIEKELFDIMIEENEDVKRKDKENKAWLKN